MEICKKKYAEEKVALEKRNALKRCWCIGVSMSQKGTVGRAGYDAGRR
jgi:hypothetical protein